jgi:glutaminyl-peptide cyclotransferase
MLADMIGDKDLDIQRETRSTGWLVDLVRQAAHKYGYDRYFFQTEEAVDDDHLAFVQRGVPSIDVIDLDYGPNNAYHHTAQDTLDKISARSLTDRRRCVHGDDPADRPAVSRIARIDTPSTIDAQPR